MNFKISEIDLQYCTRDQLVEYLIKHAIAAEEEIRKLNDDVKTLKHNIKGLVDTDSLIIKKLKDHIGEI